MNRTTEGLDVDVTSIESVVDGVPFKIPSLSPNFIRNDTFYWMYKPPISLFDEEDQLELLSGSMQISPDNPNVVEWCKNAQLLLNDLEDILELPYNKFWSNVIYDDNLHSALDSFLRLAPRWFDIDFHVTIPLLESLHDKLYSTIIRVFMRMSTSRESKTNHMSAKKFAELTSRNFDLARIVDISVLYGMNDDQPENLILKKMIMNIFSKQPDILKQHSLVTESMTDVMTELGYFCRTSANGRRSPSFEGLGYFKDGETIRSIDVAGLLSVCQAATELPASCLQLVRHTPIELLNRMTDVIKSIPEFFGSVFGPLDQEIERRKDRIPEGFADQLRGLLRLGQICSLDLFRYFIEKKLMDERSDVADESIDECQGLLMKATADRLFMLAYNSLWDVETDIATFREKEIFDEEFLIYLADSVKRIISDVVNEEGKNVFGPKAKLEGAAAPSPDAEDVKAIFPDMNSEFLEKCLDFYRGDVDELVMAIMDENLHPEMVKLRDEMAAAELEDELYKDVEVHIGKKNKFGKNFLDDKEEKAKIRDVVLRYRDVSEVMVTEDTAYDDEYDDTNDLAMVCPPDTGAENRLFETPRVFQDNGARQKKFWETQQPDEELTEEELRKKKEEFCENPEAVRARREQRFQSKLARQGKQVPPPRDVVGAAKGQGQSHDVLRNRHLKEKNKGGNRKNQSDRKRREF